MNATNFSSYNLGVNGNYPSGQMIMKHSIINHNTLPQPQPQPRGYPFNSRPANATEITINNLGIFPSAFAHVHINDIIEISLIHQQLQEQLMQDALIYERIRKSHNIKKQLQRQESDTKEREAIVGCDCKFCNGFGGTPPTYLSGAIEDDLDIDNQKSRSYFGVTNNQELAKYAHKNHCEKERITTKKSITTSCV
eukprot:342216_1